MDPEYFKSWDPKDGEHLEQVVKAHLSNMSWGTLGTVRPFPNFHPERDAVELQAALEKKDTVTLVRILTNRSNAQRQVLAKTFEDITQKDLEGAVKKAVTGDLAALLLSLLMPPQEHDAYRFQQAMAGLGTDEETLIEILSMRSRKQLDDISAAYTFLYKKDLEKELRGETSGDFAKLVVALLHKECVTGSVQRDMETLLIAVNSKKADGKPWIDMLTSRDPEHLKKVLAELEVECGQNVDHIFEKRFSGDFRLGLKVLAQCIQSPYAYLAKRLTNTKSSVLQGIMVSHSEEDLLCIRVAYLKLTGASLYTSLQKQFKGDHLQALLAVCRSED